MDASEAWNESGVPGIQRGDSGLDHECGHLFVRGRLCLTLLVRGVSSRLGRFVMLSLVVVLGLSNVTLSLHWVRLRPIDRFIF